MSRRTSLFTKVPWTGGVNTSVDPGVLPDNDLVTADNIIFATSGARIKRQGLTIIDSDFPTPLTRSSSGTTRTIVFDDSLILTSPDNYLLVIGENVKITSTDGSEALYTGVHPVLTITTTNVANDTITYIATGSLTEGPTTVSSSFLVDRDASYIDVRDYWRSDANFEKVHLLMAFSSQGKLFKYDDDGNRTEVPPCPEEETILVTANDTAGSLNTKYFIIHDQAGSVGVYLYKGSAPDTPPSADRVIRVTYAPGDIAATIAGLIQAAVDGDSQFTATVNGATVTIIDVTSGERTDVTAGDGTFTVTTTNQGRSTAEPFGSDPIERASSIIFNERFILAMTGIGNKPIRYRPEDDECYHTLLNAPDCEFFMEWQSRLFANNKLLRDRLEFSSIQEHEEWGGMGDSGAVDISPGDGDPSGITAIHAPFKGRMFVSKLNRMYQLYGDIPDETIEPISDGVGCVAHKSSAAIDFDDVIFISKKGLHSIAATHAQGAYQGQFLSHKIQPTFNTWEQRFIRFMSSIYVPELNSIAFSVIEEGSEEPNALWFYNVRIQEWYRWPNQSPICMAIRLLLTGDKKLVWGTNNSRIVQSQNGDYTDFGDEDAIRYKVRTGRVYPDNNPQTIKGFKKLSFLYKPNTNLSFTVSVRIDNLPVQGLSFSQSIVGDELGVDFILGSSVLGNAFVFSPFTMPIEGFGRGIDIEIANNNKGQQVEIYGFIVEYEPADISQEVV